MYFPFVLFSSVELGRKTSYDLCHELLPIYCINSLIFEFFNYFEEIGFIRRSRMIEVFSYNN